MKIYLTRILTAAFTCFAGIAIVTVVIFYQSLPDGTEKKAVPDDLATRPLTVQGPSHEGRPFSRRVTGHVKDREGGPVKGAHVCAEPRGPSAGPVPCATSKKDGSFELNIWWADIFTITAEHLGAGYPDARNGFYGSFFSAELPEVDVNQWHELAPVSVTVGPKAGRVVFEIRDEESGKSVESGLLKVCRADNPQMCMSTSIAFPHGRYEMLTPEVPFTVNFEVWKRGWEPRIAVGDDGSPVEVLQVGLGAKKEVIIRLRPVVDE